MTVRVLRMIEYVYEDLEGAVEDMGRWGVPPIGPRPALWFRGQTYPMIQSTIIGPLPGDLNGSALDVPDAVLGGLQNPDSPK